MEIAMKVDQWNPQWMVFNGWCAAPVPADHCDLHQQWEFSIPMDHSGQSSKLLHLCPKFRSETPFSWALKKSRLVYSFGFALNTINPINPAIPRGLRTLDARYLYDPLCICLHLWSMYTWTTLCMFFLHPTPKMHCKRIEICKYEKGIKVRPRQSRRFKDA